MVDNVFAIVGHEIAAQEASHCSENHFCFGMRLARAELHHALRRMPKTTHLKKRRSPKPT